MAEIDADVITDFSLPGNPNETDGIWGTLSGTLDFELIQEDSVLFPTGRFAQLEYTLNSSADNMTSPHITRSQITQGLRVGEIPASGTKNIFLRTNIPGDKTIGDQQGRLKVFWELNEV